MRNWKRWILSLGLTTAAFCTVVRADTEDASPAFGFAGLEIYPLDDFIGNLRAADLDGDGLTDLVVANNSRSKINLLYNQTGRTNRTPTRPRIKRELNELPPDARFRIESIASEKRIAALTVADLNSDGRPDLAYYGEPKELVVHYNEGTNGWSLPKRWPIDDGQLTANALDSGDLNGDQRADLVLLGEKVIYFFAQTPQHTLAEPEKIPYSGEVKSVQLLDINGDGRRDLMLVNWENENPFRFRLQNAQGQLGPEVHFNLPPIRSYWADDLDGDGRTEIITIAMKSGRAQISNFVRQEAEPMGNGFRQGQFEVLPFVKTSKARRGVVWGDVDADGLPDLLVAEPDTGQMQLYLQQKDGTLGPARTFPSLTGVSQIAVVPAGEGEPPWVYVLSPEERQVGRTRFEKPGRLPFPEFVPISGKPLAMAAGRLQADAPETLVVVVEQDRQRVMVWLRSDGSWGRQALSPQFKTNPHVVSVHDADQDGRNDLLILAPYEKVKVLRQRAAGGFEELDVAPPGGEMEEPWLSRADVDGDGKFELLLAQKNFLRAVVLRAEAASQDKTNQTWALQVKDQINGASLNSRLVAAAPLAEGTNAPALFLLDAGRKTLSLSRRDNNGVWQVVRNVPLPVTDFNELVPLALGARQPNSVGFVGLNAVAWMRLSGKVWQIAELDGYETPVRDGRLHDVISGDLNQDGRKDLVFLETAKHYLDVVIFNAERKLVPAVRWPVFEERTFRRTSTSQSEPREALITDVTHDGKADLVVLVHDRIIVYPQE